MDNPLYIFDTKGKNKKFITYEAVQCIYSMSIPPTKKSKMVDRKTVDKILNTEKKEMSVQFILKDLAIGEFPEQKKIYDFNDKVVLNKGDYTGINSKTETTLGKLLINKIIFDQVDYEYQNDTFDKGVITYHLNYIGSKVLSKNLSMKEYKKVLTTFEDFTLRMSSFVNPSIYIDMMILDPTIKKRREELIEENEVAIENGDTEIITEMEEELLEMVEEVYADNPQMQHYLSGAKPKLGLSYKKSSVMLGAVPANMNSTEFHATTSNLLDGINKSDIHKTSAAMILGAYFRGKQTAIGGYMAKKGISVLQGVQGDKYGTDCGTNKVREVEITESNRENYIDTYIVKGNGYELLTYDNIDDYVGSNVEMRYPMGCETEKICNKCLGDRYYKLLDNYEEPIFVGIFVVKVFTELSQKALQKTHDMTLKFSKIEDLNQYIV